jgi:hypothetical protein
MTHLIPPARENKAGPDKGLLTVCCQKNPLDLPGDDHITANERLVTCPGRKDR